MANKEKKDIYQSLGASATKAGLHSTLEGAGLLGKQKTFAILNKDFAGDSNYFSFLHNDGAGTKSIVAYLLYRELQRVDVFTGLAQDALVMNLDDIFCLGLPEQLLLSNTIQRNAKLIDDVVLGAIIKGYSDLVSLLQGFGISIQLGGGETADCGDVVRTLLVDANLAGRIKRENVIYQDRIIAGDIIVGFSNTGKTSYEHNENSSIGSNGLTLARHALLHKSCVEKFPEAADPALPSSLSYHGPYGVTDQPDSLPMSIGEALLSPTRTYAPVLSRVYQALGDNIHGAIHLTGGGQTKVLRFGEGNLYIKDNLFPTPPLFELIQKHGDVAWKEMYQVFNMGHRFELYLPEKQAQTVIDIAASFNLSAKRVGYVERHTEKANKLLLRSPHGEFEYLL